MEFLTRCGKDAPDPIYGTWFCQTCGATEAKPICAFEAQQNAFAMDFETRTKLLKEHGYSELVIETVNHAVPVEATARTMQLLSMNERQVKQINKEMIVGR